MSNQAPGFYRFRIGAFEAIALHDGVVVRDRPAGFVRNAGSEQVGEAFAAIGLPRDKLTLTFTPLALRTGQGVVLIDTGFGAGGPPGHRERRPTGRPTQISRWCAAAMSRRSPPAARAWPSTSRRSCPPPRCVGGSGRGN
jgi:hypothetical protein